MHTGVCDDDIAMCYCNGTYGRVPPADESRCPHVPSHVRYKWHGLWPEACSCLHAATRHGAKGGQWACTANLTGQASLPACMDCL